jgi:SAM-dependent methyltransferase
VRTFRDYFSASSPDYARFRPGYPRALYEWLAAESPRRERAWDCGTGSGQAAVGLAGAFSYVVATDASAAQLAAAAGHPRVGYVRSAAEASGLASGCADAIVAAQAVHWFDLPAFYEEVKRVGRPGGVVAVWTYWTLRISPEIDPLISAFYADVVGPYWPPERRLIERQYQDLDLPFAPLATPSLAMAVSMTLSDLAGYIGTWSSTQRYREAKGHDPVPALMASIEPVWGARDARATTWPLAIRAGRL